MPHLPNAIYIPGVYGKDKIKFLRSINFFVLPSKYKDETLPISMLEAMASGAYIIISDIGVVSEVLEGNTYHLINIKSEKISDEIILDFFGALSRTSNFKCLPLSSDGLSMACEYAKSELKSGRKIDFEDVLQYFCALEGGCEAIVTNDKTFPKLQIALRRTDANLEDYAPKQKN